ncbi:DUF3794 domain-containing protein [Clostridium carnis]
MSQIDVIKESVHYEQLLRESTSNHVLKGEHLIRESQYPDMKEVLGVEANAAITNKEVLGDKVMVEGELNYTVYYLPKDEVASDVQANKIHSVLFTEKFANYLELEDDEHRVLCEVECEIEHIEASWMNERKVGIDGILALNWELYKTGEFDYVKDIEGKEDIQVLKKEEVINGVKGEKEIDLMGKSIIKVTMDKPEIDEVLKCSMNLHKKEIKTGEEKVYIGCYCKIEVLYKGKENQDIITLQDDVYLSKEEEMPGITNEMISLLSMNIKNSEWSITADDLGESRVLNFEFLVKGKVKIYSKEKIELLKDAYSPTMNIELTKGDKEFGVIHGISGTEVIAKDNIYLKDDKVKLDQIICTSATAMVTDKIVEDDKVKVEGIVKASVIYRTGDEDYDYGLCVGEIPFIAAVDIKDAKKGMECIIKASVENVDATIEANTIAIRATVGLVAKVSYKVKKEWVVDITEGSDEKKEKKASVTIYVVGAKDTLWDLAKKYNTTIEELMKLNDLEDEKDIEAGDKLIIPGRAIF